MTKIYNKSIEKKKRRQLRQMMTSSEVRIWSRIRNKQLSGCKFRRQFSVGPYVLDFYCPELKLAIEIDGDTHAGKTAECYDHERQSFIESFGIRFLRFTNLQIHENLDGVLEYMGQAVQSFAKTSPNPSLPRRGDKKNVDRADLIKML